MHMSYSLRYPLIISTLKNLSIISNREWLLTPFDYSEHRDCEALIYVQVQPSIKSPAFRG